MINEENQLLGATVPQEWIDKFEILAKQTGRSVTDLVREALAQYIGIDKSSSTIVSQLEQFQSELKLLKQKIREVELYKTQIRELSVRLAVVEQSMGKVRTQLISSDLSSSSEVELIESEIDEDYEDEPDEILTDFAPRSVEY